MENKIFRKVSMERLSSPEQLDQLMTVTSPRSWAALIAVGCLLAVFLLWGILGDMPTKVSSQGILIKAGGVSNVVNSVSGQIADIRVAPGDIVNKGDVVARIVQNNLVDEIREAEAQMAMVKKNGPPEKIATLEKQISILQDRLELDSRIVTPYQGRVLELKVNKGDFLAPGTALFSIEKGGGSVVDLEAILYVPLEEGKKIIPGMDAQIAPTVVKKEEYGYILGRVISVSDYPATFEGMMRVLDNKELVEKLSGQGAPIEVRVALTPDPATVSGYKWSSGIGPKIKISSGTLCLGSLTIKRQRPISMLGPQ